MLYKENKKKGRRKDILCIHIHVQECKCLLNFQVAVKATDTEKLKKIIEKVNKLFDGKFILYY
jgi:hypothetical protein